MKIWLSASVGVWLARYATPTDPRSNGFLPISATPMRVPLPPSPHDFCEAMLRDVGSPIWIRPGCTQWNRSPR